MRNDSYGQQVLSENDLCNLYLQDPERIIHWALIEKEIKIDKDLGITNVPEFKLYQSPTGSMENFDNQKQNFWYMPEEYKNFDIAKFVLDQCKVEAEFQRAGEELLMFQERDMFMILRYLKYLVDTMRKYNIVWGVGRGSSVASYVLYLIGVHRINSLHYDLSIDEFLK
jgi:DNA polymerase III alpha subunit